MSDLLVVDAVYQLITEFMNITEIKIGCCDRNLILDAEILFKSSMLNTSFFILFSESRWNACSSASSYSCRKAIQKWARKRRGRISNRKVSCFFAWIRDTIAKVYKGLKCIHMKVKEHYKIALFGHVAELCSWKIWRWRWGFECISLLIFFLSATLKKP